MAGGKPSPLAPLPQGEGNRRGCSLRGLPMVAAMRQYNQMQRIGRIPQGLPMVAVVRPYN